MDNRVNTASWSEAKGRWRIKVQRDGQVREFTSSTPGRAGQREANAKADKWLAEGTDQRLERKRVSGALKDYLAYLEELTYSKRKASGNLGVKTGDSLAAKYGSYRSDACYLLTWMEPAIGNKMISNLRDGDIQRILDKAAAEGKAQKTVCRIRGAMSAFLKWSRKNGYTKYRMEDVDTPRNARPSKKRILQPSDLQKLFANNLNMWDGKTAFEPYIYAFRFQVLTGMRPGEVIGLRWSDITDDEIHIKRSINVDGEQTKGKNNNAQRTIYLFPLLKQQLQAQKLYTGKDTGYVFCIKSSNDYSLHLRRFLEFNDMTVLSPYELRHTFVSVIQQLPELTVKSLVGHSKAMDTEIYSHEMQGYGQKTANNLENIFGEILEEKKA